MKRPNKQDTHPKEKTGQTNSLMLSTHQKIGFFGLNIDNMSGNMRKTPTIKKNTHA